MRPWQVKTLLTLMVLLFLLCYAYSYSSIWDNEHLWFDLDLVSMGILIAGPSLLALWAAFGSESIFVRFPRTIFIASLIPLALYFGERFSGSNLFRMGFSFFSFIQFVALCIPFLIIRKYSKWRLVEPYSGIGEDTTRASRFSIARLFQWQAYLAIVLFLGVLLINDQDESIIEIATIEVVFVGMIFAALTFHTLFIFFVVLCDQNRQLSIKLAIVFSLLTFIGCLLGISLDGTNIEAKESIDMLVVLISVQITAIGALLLVRMMGYRLVRTTATNTVDSVSERSVEEVRIGKKFVIPCTILTLIVCVMVFDLESRMVAHAEATRSRRWFNLGIQLIESPEGGGDKLDFYLGHKVKAEALRVLENQPNIESVEFSSSLVTDNQLKRVGRLTHLKAISLNNTRITDIGLSHLEGMHALRELNLTDSKVTPAGVRRLQEALPECEIIFPLVGGSSSSIDSEK